MRKVLMNLFLSLLTGFVGAWLLLFVTGGDRPANVVKKETAFERVMRTSTIRCGYAYAEPLVIKDPTTGEMSGMAHDVIEAVGKALSLKVVWTEEVGWASFPAALASGRIDAFCVGAWLTAARARGADHTVPFSFQSYYAYVRSDDNRFDGRISDINDPSVTIAFVDGDGSSLVARSDFSKAKMLSLPQLASEDEVFINVAQHKADVALLSPEWFVKYDHSNPGKIRQVESAPIRVFGNVFFIAHGEDKLRQMFNAALMEQLSSGAVEKIISKYEKKPGSILRVAAPYAR
ncbi:MAG: substrate-binding periplasmic protein [Bdellovibrionales bacterium]